jgi:hypothetical protein
MSKSITRNSELSKTSEVGRRGVQPAVSLKSEKQTGHDRRR